MAERPNILWLTYEDTSPQFVSCYGQTPVATTPRMDALAAAGVRFDNAYATAPVCSASRSALITGICNEATGLGHHRSKYPIPRGTIRGFPWYLQQAGYCTTNNEKTDYNITDEPDFIAETWHESSATAHWRNRDEGQPFFSVFNYADSHQSRTMTMPWGWYEEHVLGQLAPEEIISPDAIAMPPIYRDSEEMRRHVSRVYNSLRLCDRRIGERLDELAADRLLEETIIFCFADHGEGIPRGKCNAIGFGYRASFVAWIPEAYRHLSPWGTGVVTDELVSFEDLAPTVLSLAGVEVPAAMTGRALMGAQRRPPPKTIFAARNRIDDTPDLCRSAIDGRFVYTRNYFPHLPVVKYQKYSDVGDILRAIRRDHAAGLLEPAQAELVEPTRPREYLYDLAADPWEIRNLAAEDAYQADLERLRQATVDHLHAVHDVMFLPESSMVDCAAGSTPYEKRADKAYNPLAALHAAAELVGDPDALPRQITLLDHEDEGVRYWAAVGIYAARHRLGEQTEAVQARLQQEEAAVVQVELAAALVSACQDEAAQRLLASHIESANVLIAHQAISKVLYMPDVAARFSTPIRRAHARLGEEVGAASFPAQQAAEMYLFLYEGHELYYKSDLPYIDPAKRVRDWA